MSGFYTDAEGKLHKFAGTQIGSKSALPVGSIFASAIPLTDIRVHLLDGTSIAQDGIYSNFAGLIKSLVSAGYNISCSQTEFNNAVSSTGNCGKFVIDDSANIIRLPKITRFVQGLSNMIDIGKSVEAGLPNITGTDRGIASQSFGLSGAFYEKSMSGTGTVYQDATTDTSYTRTGFDASRSSSIYGNSTTVQPQATSFPYYIVLISGFTASADFDITNYLKDTETIKSKYIKSATIENDILKITDQNNNIIEFQGGGGSSENCVSTNTEQEISAYKNFLEGIGISDTFNLKKLESTTETPHIDPRNLKDGIYFLPRNTSVYIQTNGVTSLGEGFYIVSTKTNGGTGKYWFYFGERSGQPTIMKGYLTTSGGSYEEVKTSGFIKTGETYTQNISCHYSGEKSVLSLTGHSTEGTFLDFVNFEDGIGKTCSIGINEEFKPVFIDKDGVESELGGGGSANIIWKEWS